MDCYCCSGKIFAECCEPFIKGAAKPQQAEELMRSRYSAYAAGAIDYLIGTTHPATRKQFNRETLAEWSKTSDWQRLDVLASFESGAKDKKGTVEFKAYYAVDGQPQTHHELSNFKKELGKWFYVDGKTLTD